MNRILWKGAASIETRAFVEPTESELALVNRWTASGAATAGEVYLCSAMVCNDVVDHYSTRFTARALEQIAALLPGVNLMRNHNEYGSEDLPIGRIYAAELVTIGDAQWVRARFYWERGTPDGDAMAKRISLGIWREVSLSWWMRSFTNDVDGKPVSESPYYPGQQLPDGRVVVGIMDDVTEVNETSIVPRGGQKGTSIGDVRGADDPSVFGAVAAARARQAGVDVERADWFARYGRREQPVPMASFYAALGIRTESKK